MWWYHLFSLFMWMRVRACAVKWKRDLLQIDSSMPIYSLFLHLFLCFCQKREKKKFALRIADTISASPLVHWPLDCFQKTPRLGFRIRAKEMCVCQQEIHRHHCPTYFITTYGPEIDLSNKPIRWGVRKLFEIAITSQFQII